MRLGKVVMQSLVVALLFSGSILLTVQASLAEQTIEELANEMRTQMYVAYSGTFLASMIHVAITTGNWNYFEAWRNWCGDSPEIVRLRQTNSIAMPTFSLLTQLAFKIFAPESAYKNEGNAWLRLLLGWAGGELGNEVSCYLRKKVINTTLVNMYLVPISSAIFSTIGMYSNVILDRVLTGHTKLQVQIFALEKLEKYRGQVLVVT